MDVFSFFIFFNLKKNLSWSHFICTQSTTVKVTVYTRNSVQNSRRTTFGPSLLAVVAMLRIRKYCAADSFRGTFIAKQDLFGGKNVNQCQKLAKIILECRVYRWPTFMQTFQITMSNLQSMPANDIGRLLCHVSQMKHSSILAPFKSNKKCLHVLKTLVFL